MTKLEKIHAAAIELFNEKGFQATSTTSITKHAGVGTGTLFLYYKSKDDLINAIYAGVKQEMVEEIHQVYNTDLGFEQNFKSIWMVLIGWGVRNPKKFRFLNEIQNSPIITKVTQEQVTASFAFFADMIEQAQQDELIREESYEFLSVLIGGQFSATINYLINITEGDRQRMIELSYDILWNGLKR